MATSRRPMRETRSSSGSKQQHHGRSTPPPPYDELMAQQQSDGELSPADDNTQGRRRRGQGTGVTSSRNSPSEDLLDGTMQRFPSGSPSTPPGKLSPSSPHTSGHTHCHSRTTTTTTTTTPPRRPTHREEEEVLLGKKTKGINTAHHHQGPTPIVLIFICLLVLVGIYSVHQALNARDEEQKAAKKIKPITQVYSDLKLELQSLNREFVQPREVWLGILGQLEGVMIEEPSQPAVLLLVVPDDSRGAASCLAHHLAKAVQYAFEDNQFVMFDTRSSNYLGDSAALKLELDHSLQGLAGAHVAVVHNVESLPGQAAIILHAYCDNENAPYKQAIIFLLVEVPGTYNELAYSRIDSLVDSHLADAWGAKDMAGSQGLKEKDVSALISRTANAPILVKPERAARMMEMCPV